MKLTAAVTLASLILLSGVCAAFAAQTPARSEFHHSYPLSATGGFTLENTGGDVNVIGWNRNAVQVDATLCAPTADDLKSLVISVNSTAGALSVMTIYPKKLQNWWEGLWDSSTSCDKRGEVDYTVHVPLRAVVSLKSTNGDLSVTGPTGTLSLESTSGDVSAQDVGDVSAVAVSGDVTLTRAKGTCHVTETSGRTLLRGVSGSITATSVSGDVDLYQTTGKAVVSTTSGDITARDFSGIARLNSTSGDITMTLVRGSGVALSASTVGGSLNSDVPIRDRAPVQARTVSGDISARYW